MDAFESLVATLLRHQGYWTVQNYKVKLTATQKKWLNLANCPRWDIDVVAYKAKTNELLAVECKSYLASKGVNFHDGHFHDPSRYKLFENANLRRTVLHQLVRQLVKSESVRDDPRPKAKLCLAAGKIAGEAVRQALSQRFEKKGWRLFDDTWLCHWLEQSRAAGYQNDLAYTVAKLLDRQNANDEDTDDPNAGR